MYKYFIAIKRGKIVNQLEREEYLQILIELDQAYRNFNNAEDDFVEVGIFQVKVAQCKVDAFITARR